MTEPRLPEAGRRLRAAMELAGPVRCFADIGADHGILSALMLRSQPSASALLTDISPLALQKARNLIAYAGLGERAAFFVGDGFAPLRGQSFDTAFILGMGGDTVAGILRRGQALLSGAGLILSGHTHIPLLRETVYRIGYHITDEALAREKERYYFILRCEAGDRPMPGAEELFLGKPLPLRRTPEWIAYMDKQHRHYLENTASMRAARQEKDRERYRLACERLRFIENALPAGSAPKGE